jgi:hypothetical protein
MSAEKVTVEQAIQKLSKANNNNNARLNDLENKLTEIHLNTTDQYNIRTAFNCSKMCFKN